MNSHTTHNAVRNIFFSGVRLAVGLGAGIFTSAIIARRLGPSNMGVYGYAMWLVGTLGVLANVGLPAAIVKYVSEFIGSGDRAMAARIGKRLILTQLSIAAGVSGVTVGFALLKTPYRSVIVLASIMLFAQALQQSLGAALAGVQRFDQGALIGIYTGLAQIATVGVAALLHSGIMGMLWATLAGLWISAWLLYRSVNRYLLQSPEHSQRDSLPETPETLRRIMRFAFATSYILLLDTIVWQRSEVLFLKWYSPIIQIAFYTVAYSIASKMGDIANVITSILLPLYSESYGRSGLREVGRIFTNALRYLQIVMVPLCLLAAAIAAPLIHLVYGSKYLPLVIPLQILLMSQAFSCTGAVNSCLLYGTEKQGFIVRWGTLIAILNIVLDLILIPKLGALGAAVANCTAQVAGVFTGNFYAVRYIHVSFPWKSTATVYSAALIAVAPAAYLARRSHSGIALLIGSVVIGAGIYIGLLMAARELGKRDLDMLKGALLAKALPSEPFQAVEPA